MAMQSPSEAEAFYNFLGDTIRQGDRETPLDALVRKWRAEQEFSETCEAIREAIADVEAGRVQTLEEFDFEFRQTHGLPPRSSS